MSIDFSNMFDMFFESVAWIYKNVIQICDAKSIQIVVEGIIDIDLKDHWGIAKIKEHDKIFEVIIMGVEDCFPLITLDNAESIEDV